MTGIEYVLTKVKEPNLFVITKQKKDAPETITPVATYYVLYGSIYQAPSLRNVLEAKMGRVMHHISNAFKTTASNLEKIGYVGSESGPTANFEI
ncbi:putative transcription regulator MED6 family [Rosa chinensis]|uniref:Mediator of RNA polymerase II transcription subunit 6 n=1 Tax=Rosa chinensis TaxID=74649 RepID=A0A2P6QIM9_ROSCH|nr:putative transcription regulator MED6 family [Rosa chinensis]